MYIFNALMIILQAHSAMYSAYIVPLSDSGAFSLSNFTLSVHMCVLVF